MGLGVGVGLLFLWVVGGGREGVGLGVWVVGFVLLWYFLYDSFGSLVMGF